MTFRINGYMKRSTEVGFFDLTYRGETTHQDTASFESYLQARTREQMEPKFVLPITKDGTTVGFQIIFEKSEWIELPVED